eukprot:9263662-Pyramimonas_sp.AAC.1
MQTASAVPLHTSYVHLQGGCATAKWASGEPCLAGSARSPPPPPPAARPLPARGRPPPPGAGPPPPGCSA